MEFSICMSSVVFLHVPFSRSTPLRIILYRWTFCCIPLPRSPLNIMLHLLYTYICTSDSVRHWHLYKTFRCNIFAQHFVATFCRNVLLRHFVATLALSLDILLSLHELVLLHSLPRSSRACAGVGLKKYRILRLLWFFSFREGVVACPFSPGAGSTYFAQYHRLNFFAMQVGDSHLPSL